MVCLSVLYVQTIARSETFPAVVSGATEVDRDLLERTMVPIARRWAFKIFIIEVISDPSIIGGRAHRNEAGAHPPRVRVRSAMRRWGKGDAGADGLHG
jgi:hypothetical protein